MQLGSDHIFMEKQDVSVVHSGGTIKTCSIAFSHPSK